MNRELLNELDKKVFSACVISSQLLNGNASTSVTSIKIQNDIFQEKLLKIHKSRMGL